MVHAVVETKSAGFAAVRKAPPVRKRDAVIAATGRMLQTMSFDALDFSSVAAEAGVTRRTLYNQFSDKTTLYRAVLEPAIMRLAAQLELDIQHSAYPRDALWLFATRNAMVLGDPQNIEVVRCVIRDGRKLPWLAEIYSRHVRQPLISYLELWLLRRAGRDPSLDAPQVSEIATQFLCMIEGLVVTPKLFPGPGTGADQQSGERTINALVDAFLMRTGLAARGSA